MKPDLPQKGGYRNQHDDRHQQGKREPRKRARRRALQALYQWRITDQRAEEILQQFRHAQDLSQIDEPYFESLLRGVIAGHKDIDRRLQPFLDRPIKQVDVMEQTILRLGAWELLQCPEVPYRVVLNEYIDLAHRFGAEQGHAFVNGVLDKAAKAWRPEEVDDSFD
jgi:N utilization substance protein B